MGKGEIVRNAHFSFSHSVFYHFRELCTIFIKFEFVVCKTFSLEESKICRLGKSEYIFLLRLSDCCHVPLIFRQILVWLIFSGKKKIAVDLSNKFYTILS